MFNPVYLTPTTTTNREHHKISAEAELPLGFTDITRGIKHIEEFNTLET